jgi:hypothetical protein
MSETGCRFLAEIILLTTLGINTMTHHTPLQPLSEELFVQQNEVMAAMHDYE